MTVSVVYSTNQGLGRLAKDFYDNGIIERVLIIHHQRHENHYEWFPNRVATIDELLHGATTLLGFETFMDPRIARRAKELGITTTLIPMYECTSDADIKLADRVINPSALDQQYFPQGTHISIPVNVPWKLRSRARIFVHNAGNGGLGGRNGTQELLDAMQHVKSPIKLIVRSQQGGFISNDPRVEIRIGTVPFEELYNEGDVFIFPEKFNGLSLPLQEAYASGMLVMTTDRMPNNTYLPNEPLIPISRYERQSIARGFDAAILDPKIIASTIDAWFNKDIKTFSRKGKQWAIQHSWKALLPKYKSALG